MKQNKLYVGSLSSRTTETELREAFSKFGSIDYINIIIDRYTGESKGIMPLVEYSSPAEIFKKVGFPAPFAPTMP